WDTYDPHEWLWVSQREITQQELEDSGVEYRHCEEGGYLVEKSDLQKFHDYTIRTLVTPLTVIVDGAPILVYMAVHTVDHCLNK
ncbi:hypothetical protein ACFL3F_04840, partial [Planctomycetota bacterium]